MDTPQKSSKPISPAAAICFGVLCFGLASLTLWSGISGLMAGKTHTMGRGVHDLIVKQDTPGESWCWIVAHFIVAAIGYTGAVIILLSGFRRIRPR